MNTRRKFLLGCSAISTATLLVPARILAEAVLPARKRASSEDLSLENFTRQLNTTFRIHADSTRSILVKLDEVRVLPDTPQRPGKPTPGDAGYEKFTLIFSGRRSELISQETYRFEHEALGRFELFTVPVFTRNPAKMDYAVVVNRRLDPAFKTSS